jgi:hypothetical protein
MVSSKGMRADFATRGLAISAVTAGRIGLAEPFSVHFLLLAAELTEQRTLTPSSSTSVLVIEVFVIMKYL